MPAFDAPAAAALAQATIIPAEFVFVDFGDPLRVTTFGRDVTVTGSGDPELDGTYSAVSAKLLEFGETTQKEGGSEQFTVTMSGILSIDPELLAAIGDVSKWRGRVIRRWKRLYDEADVAIGAFVPHETGYMLQPEILPSPEAQTIRMHCANYLAAFSQASGRSYLGQADYDAADQSARATIGAANNATSGPAAGVDAGGRSGAGIGRGSPAELMRAF